VSLSCFAIREFGPAGFGGCFLASSLSSEVLRLSRQERGRANFGLQPGRLTFLMDSWAVLLLRSVFPFTRPWCATPGLLLPLKRRRLRRPSPHHRVVRAFSPAAYRRGLPTIGRWRASPVMVQDHFLQAATCNTLMVRDRHSARSIPRRGFGSPSALPPRGGVWRTIPAEVPSPEVSLPGPFVLAPSPDLPVVLSWLHTTADNCGVRAESSVRARTRTGRLWLVVILLSWPHPFFWWYT
jgi:hypothetical protein